MSFDGWLNSLVLFQRFRGTQTHTQATTCLISHCSSNKSYPVWRKLIAKPSTCSLFTSFYSVLLMCTPLSPVSGGWNEDLASCYIHRINTLIDASKSFTFFLIMISSRFFFLLYSRCSSGFFGNKFNKESFSCFSVTPKQAIDHEYRKLRKITLILLSFSFRLARASSTISIGPSKCSPE